MIFSTIHYKPPTKEPTMSPFEGLFELTSSAHMFKHFTRYEWEAILYHLQARGLTQREVVVFTLSKHIRWADDQKPTNRKSRASDIIHYLVRNFKTNEELKSECQGLIRGADHD